jgi:hypothetical protein
MPNLNLKGIPTKLFQRLKKSAKENRRSLTSEIIFRMEQSMTAGTALKKKQSLTK